jgi:hypothetical protein
MRPHQCFEAGFGLYRALKSSAAAAIDDIDEINAGRKLQGEPDDARIMTLCKADAPGSKGATTSRCHHLAMFEPLLLKPSDDVPPPEVIPDIAASR